MLFGSGEWGWGQYTRVKKKKKKKKKGRTLLHDPRCEMDYLLFRDGTKDLAYQLT